MEELRQAVAATSTREKLIQHLEAFLQGKDIPPLPLLEVAADERASQRVAAV